MDAIYWQDQSLALLDQRKLPTEALWITYTDYRQVAQALCDGVVTDPTAVAIGAAYGYALAAIEFDGLPEEDFVTQMATATQGLSGAHQNSALARMALRQTQFLASPDRTAALIVEAISIHRQDVMAGRSVSRFGVEIIPEDGNVLTLCHGAGLTTGGAGAPLSVLRYAHNKCKVKMVYSCESADHLPSWSLQEDGVPTTVVDVAAAAHLMAQRKVDVVVVGCQSMAANGDFVGALGTYGVAIAAYFHGLPFYVALPTSSVDFTSQQGSEFTLGDKMDVTPHGLVTGLITEKGIVYPDFQENLANQSQEQTRGQITHFPG